ncbi:enoyl-ACP reductase FabV [Candidatus Soleaferrea massiliensis]|uniref:enoyl-ACP reductase FabV n=1 Tax=Candidatus Soleaferrea massiliensis TaxID=1470354 RepID=UPI00058D0BE8|nr:enoyl-ACP reductase FabV [Candidatus Soleaferrea massiliensis]
MIVEPKVRGFICTTAHWAGCKENVRRQIETVKNGPRIDGPKKVLVIGASTGYGLASRISSTFGCGAATIGVIFDKPASGNRTASAGWYNTAAFEEFAAADGCYAKTVNGDAFSDPVKRQTIELIKQDLGKVDMVVYSLASPRRTTADGRTYTSVLKTTGEPYANKTIDLKSKKVSEITIEPASEEEIQNTVKVMGGEDWFDWMQALRDADVLEQDAVTIAYSYIGPSLTHPIYRDGSIGMAKRHLHETAGKITKEFADLGVKGYISVNKALVTQSSAAIPVVPLYISILYRIMKDLGSHEGCIEQIHRLYAEKLFGSHPVLDEDGLIRMDDWEMRPEVQEKVTEVWNRIDDGSLESLADLEGYWEDFYQMFGFQIPGIDYQQDIDIDAPIPSLQ